MVTVRISDGLGNQMFQYACALAVAKGNWKEIVLDTSEVDNLGVRQYSLDLYKVRYKKRFSWSNKSIWKKVIKKLKYIIYYKRIKEKKPFYYDKSIFNQRSSRVYLYGYWQSYKYFEQYTNVLREFFVPKAETIELKEWINTVEEKESCAVHIRRGDYAEVGSCIEKKFFEDSMLKMIKECHNVRFYIFSDDIEWVKKAYAHFFVNNNVDWVQVSGTSSLSDAEELYIMSKCNHQIVSPSTFSWWAAFLNDNKSKMVIAPYHVHWAGDFWPPDWILIESSFEGAKK